jgi:hypothetical protein
MRRNALPRLRPPARSSVDRARELLGHRAPREGKVERARELLRRYDDDQAVAALDLQEKEREERRLRSGRRGASGWRRGTPQCPGCRRLLSGYGQPCGGCGFVPGYGYPR